MRRLTHSTASQSQTLCALLPTNVHISSSSSASRRFFCAFLRRKRDKGGTAFFCQFRDRYPCHTGRPHDTTLGVALDQQLGYLLILRRFCHCCRREPRLITARFALILGVALATAVASNMFAAALGAEVLGINHNVLYAYHLQSDHRQETIILPPILLEFFLHFIKCFFYVTHLFFIINSYIIYSKMQCHNHSRKKQR